MGIIGAISKRKKWNIALLYVRQLLSLKVNYGLCSNQFEPALWIFTLLRGWLQDPNSVLAEKNKKEKNSQDKLPRWTGDGTLYQSSTITYWQVIFLLLLQKSKQNEQGGKKKSKLKDFQILFQPPHPQELHKFISGACHWHHLNVLSSTSSWQVYLPPC